MTYYMAEMRVEIEAGSMSEAEQRADIAVREIGTATGHAVFLDNVRLTEGETEDER